MASLNFGELKALIKRDLAREDLDSDTATNLTDDTITYYVLAAIDHFKPKKLWFNQKVDTSFTITANSDTVDLPSDFIDVVEWRITATGSTQTIRRAPYVQIELARASDDVTNSTAPDVYDIFEEKFQIYPQATSNLTTTLSYIYELSTLSLDTDANEWTRDGRMLISSKAKEYIAANIIKNTGLYNRMQQQVGEEYRRLRDRTVGYQSTGRVHVESLL